MMALVTVMHVSYAVMSMVAMMVVLSVVSVMAMMTVYDGLNGCDVLSWLSHKKYRNQVRGIHFLRLFN